MNRLVLHNADGSECELLCTSDPLTIESFAALGDPCNVFAVTTRCYRLDTLSATFAGEDAIAAKTFSIEKLPKKIQE